MRCVQILIVCALTIGCSVSSGSARRQGKSPLGHLGSELIHGNDWRARDNSIRHAPQQSTPTVIPDAAAAGDSPPAFSYDLYCDNQGHFSHDGAALALVKRPSHLERVYADAARGELRSQQLIHELEYWFQQTGRALADRTAALGCLALPELQTDCHPPNWGFLEQLLGNTPAGLRLREVLAEAYARRAHHLNVRSDIIVGSVNLLLIGSLARTVLARAGVVETGMTARQILAQEARTAAGAEALARRAGEIHRVLDPLAQMQRTTAVLDSTAGRIVTGGARDLTPAQRAALLPGEIAGKLPGAHAEVTALHTARQLGGTPRSMGVTRAICPACRAAIEQSGSVLTSPTTAVWPK